MHMQRECLTGEVRGGHMQAENPLSWIFCFHGVGGSAPLFLSACLSFLGTLRVAKGGPSFSSGRRAACPLSFLLFDLLGSWLLPSLARASCLLLQNSSCHVFLSMVFGFCIYGVVL